jgi:hypothetical protein
LNVSYDSRYNIAYIRLREKAAEVETIRISDEIAQDFPKRQESVRTLGAVPIKCYSKPNFGKVCSL